MCDRPRVGLEISPLCECAALAQSAWRGIKTAAWVASPRRPITLRVGLSSGLARCAGKKTRKPNPDWCQPATDEEWTRLIRGAISEAASNPRTVASSVVIYAWNESSEGGWIQPTLSEGVRRLKVIASATGRHPTIPPFKLT